MIREHIFSSRTPTDPHFRWRGGDVSRIEGLSDAAFAFAMTMMVVDAFKTIDSHQALLDGLKQIPALVACFAVLIWIWGIHYRFFRRFGLEDGMTIFFNSVLLLTVMIYAYLLKYLFTQLLAVLVWREAPSPDRWAGPTIMLIYGIGFVLIFVWIALMVWHGYRQRERLQLDAVEVYIARASIRDHLFTAGTGVLSILITTVGPLIMPTQIALPAAGFTYALNGPIHWWHGVHVDKRVTALTGTLAPPDPADPPAERR